jgi:hypothetical protein
MGLVVLAPVIVSAKRGPAPQVPPLEYEGVRYIAPNDQGNRGYIQARDAKTNRLLWEVTVYTVFINPALEEDVQWILIKKMSLRDGCLIVIDERNRAFNVDLKKHSVRR